MRRAYKAGMMVDKEVEGFRPSIYGSKSRGAKRVSWIVQEQVRRPSYLQMKGGFLVLGNR